VVCFLSFTFIEQSPTTGMPPARSFKKKNIMITISDLAKEKVAKLRADAELDDQHFLRASVAGGGCSGLSYKLDFDDEIKPMDQEFEDKGVKIVVDMKSFLYLAGTELKFSDGLNGKGFYFDNPNASRTCGCGDSFSV
jgi:iron-sulfur cluster assembly protein